MNVYKRKYEEYIFLFVFMFLGEPAMIYIIVIVT